MCDGTLRSGRKASNYRAAILAGIRLALKKRDHFCFMKTLSILAAVCAFAFGANLWAAEPAKESERDQQEIAALTKDLQGQQAVIADNQKKIDEKIAAVMEALRQARIYAGRGR